MKPHPCADCATTDGVAIDNLCDPCRTERVRASRAAQGLPPTLTPDVAARVVQIVTHRPLPSGAVA